MEELEEKLIEFKTAKLAKEKGFSVHCKSYYVNDTQICENEDFPYNSWSNNLFAPTQSLLQKWLREKHNSIVEIVYSKQDYTSPIKFESTVDYFTKELEYEITINPEFSSEKFLKYEDALEIGLFNALKLIN